MDSEYVKLNALDVETKSKSRCNSHHHECDHLENLKSTDGQINFATLKTYTNHSPDCQSTKRHFQNLNDGRDCQCKFNQETQPYTNTLEKKAVRFTEEMIRDQEMLVSSMSQQGIPVALIRRQFDRLLDEQSKQLQLHADAKIINKKGSKENVKTEEEFKNQEEVSDRFVQTCDSQITCNTFLNDANTSKKMNENETNTNQLEPSSLLKIRLKRETLESRLRNNGLQEPVEAFRIMEKCKRNVNVSSDDKESKISVKLNGTQNENETIENLHAVQTLLPVNMAKNRISANGLDNSKDLSISASALKLSDSEGCKEKQSNIHPPCNCQISSQSAHGKAYSDSCRNLTKDVTSANLPKRQESAQSFSDSRIKKNNIAECKILNNFMFHPEFQEPKIIGGLTYFARKPQCIPNIQGFLCDNYTCVNHSKPATAF